MLLNKTETILYYLPIYNSDCIIVNILETIIIQQIKDFN